MYKLWFEFWGNDIYSSILTLGTSFSNAESLKIRADVLCLKDQLCAIAGVAQNSAG